MTSAKNVLVWNQLDFSNICKTPLSPYLSSLSVLSLAKVATFVEMENEREKDRQTKQATEAPRRGLTLYILSDLILIFSESASAAL